MTDIYHQNDRPGDIRQEDWIRYLKEDLGREQWLTVYHNNKGEFGATVFFCALVPNAMVDLAMDNESWDLTIGAGSPGCSIQYASGEEKVTYHRFGGTDGVEPLVLWREFHGVKDDYPEVSEEFRLLHNLYHDRNRNVFVKIDEAGNEEDVIRLEPERVQIRLLQLKQFLAIKEMHLASYFSIDRRSIKAPLELGLAESSSRYLQGNLAFRFDVSGRLLVDDKFLTTTRLEGKKLIAPIEKERSGIWPYEDNSVEVYEDFVIGTDEDGNPVSHTSDPEKLANFFGKNPDAPNYLTPVFFRREVLRKYYARPELYRVEDGYLHCAGLWGLRMDNDHADHVVVYLGDLGRDLPRAERGYWKSFNVSPSGTISPTAFARGVLAQPMDPETPELAFKERYRDLRSVWEEKFGWSLFVPGGTDEHTLATLHTPLTEDQAEFDQQLLTLAGVLVGALNKPELQQRVGIKRASKGNVGLLERFLRQSQAAGLEQHLKFLTELDAARQRANQPTSVTKTFTLEGGRVAAFGGILKQAIRFLEFLEQLASTTSRDGFSVKGPKAPREKARPLQPKPDNEVDFAIITIIPEELQAVTRLIPDLSVVSGTEDEPNLYYWQTGKIVATRYAEPYRVVVALAGSAGTSNGAMVTYETIERWRPRYVLLVGIAGGLPQQDLRKGDVVLSSHIWGYEYGKLAKGFQPRPNHMFAPDTGLFNCAVGFSGAGSGWREGLTAEMPEAGRTPKVVHGPVASGDKVVDDIGDSFFRAVLKQWPKLQAIEMEGVGATTAIQKAQAKGRRVGFLMVRGISDMPPDHKAAGAADSQTAERDAWKAYASASAATFAIRYVEAAWPLPPRAQR